MGAALPAVVIAGTLLSAAAAGASQFQQAQATRAQAQYRERVAQNNQILAERAAEDARERGKIEERQRRILTEQQLGQQRAASASRGVDVNVGSALDLQADTAAFGELDALTIRSNAEREALGFETQGADFQSEARIRSLEADSANKAASLGIATTALTTGGAVASKWFTFREKGALP